MHKEKRIETFDGFELFYVCDIPENPVAVVILVHGINEHQGRYDHVVERLNDERIAVYRFDNRGHGNSGGKRAYIDDFYYFVDDADQITNLARKDYPELPLFMLGHSMGGFITVAYGVRYPDKLEGQILSGALTNEITGFEEIMQMDVENNPDMPIPNQLGDLVSRDQEVVEEYQKDPLVLKFTTLKLFRVLFDEGISWLVERLPKYNYPCLILHGGDDRLVDPSCSKKMYQIIASNDKELKIYEGLYHEIMNEPEKEEVIGDILDWIKKRV